MPELRLRRAAGTLSADATDLRIVQGASDARAKQLYEVIYNEITFENELRFVRDFPNSAPTETPSTPSAEALIDYDVQITIGSNPTGYWRKVGLYEVAVGLFTWQWIAPGPATGATFLFDVADNGRQVYAQVSYYIRENGTYPGPLSAASNTVTIGGGLGG